MTMTEHENATGLAMVKAGYAVDDPSDDHRVLNFRVGFDSPAGAGAALRAIGSYNAFDGEAVAQAVETALSGSGHLRIEVGRESSPVLYVGPFYGSSAERSKLMESLRQVSADEIDKQGEYVWAWWG